jgi:hypothetical protein
MQDLDYPLSNFTRLLRDVLLGLTVLVGSFFETLYRLDHVSMDYIKTLKVSRPSAVA